MRDTEIPSILSEMLERHEISRRLTYLLPHYWCSLKQIISNIVAPEVFTYSIQFQEQFESKWIWCKSNSHISKILCLLFNLCCCCSDSLCTSVPRCVPCNLCNVVSRVCLSAQAWKHICWHFWCISLQDCLSSGWWWW